MVITSMTSTDKHGKTSTSVLLQATKFQFHNVIPQYDAFMPLGIMANRPQRLFRFLQSITSFHSLNMKYAHVGGNN